ncbi:MAG TPA: hypothetical protein VFG43_06015 [Geminicoccaceae bacterium]|nr:hypothetical protein [Geminicoccaceae bacterium]
MREIRHTRRRLLVGLAGSAALAAPPLDLAVTLLRPRRAAAAAADRALAGLLYGSPFHGDSVSNANIRFGSPSALAFRAERTGRITAFRFDLRRSSASEIAQGRAYSEGDGGRIRISIRPRDEAGLPTAEVLGQSAVNAGFDAPPCLPDGTINPASVPRIHAWPLLEPVPVEAGRRYCVHFENLAGSGMSGTNFMLTYRPIGLGSGQHAGPYWGDDVHLLREFDASWTDRRSFFGNSGGLFEFVWEDGIVTGDPHVFSSYGYQRAIDATNLVRQRFTVHDFDRRVDGLWTRVWYRPGQRPSALVVRLEEATSSDSRRPDAALVEQVDAPREAFSSTDNSLGDADSPPARWARLRFAAPHRLVPGRTYHLQLGCADGGYRTHTVRRIPTTTNRNLWAGSHAQYSTDGGASWQGIDDQKYRPGVFRDDVDLPLAFTLAG